MINILVLTTKTYHHQYFCQELKKKYNFKIICETKKIIPKYKTYHPYHKKRDKFEISKFFKNKKNKFNYDFALKDLNQKKSINLIKKIKPSHILCFGVSKLNNIFLREFKKIQILNLHGGDPEFYRGLDSLLWSIYFNDFGKMYTALHIVENRLDTGDIIFKKKLKIEKKLTLVNLRYYNTLNCLALVDSFFNKILNNKLIKVKKQKRLGKYYSFFPSSNVNTCYKNLKNYKLL